MSKPTDTVTLTYTGPLPEGYVSCPFTGVQFPFKAGEPVEFPAVTAAGLNPAIWQPVPKKGTGKKDQLSTLNSPTLNSP